MAEKKPIKSEAGKFAQMSSTDTIPAANIPATNGISKILATVTGIDGLATGVTNLYTPSGVSAVITAIIVRPTTITGAGNGPRLKVGNNGTQNNIMTVQNLSALTSTGDLFRYSAEGIYKLAQTAVSIDLNITVAATVTTYTFSVDLIGYTI